MEFIWMKQHLIRLVGPCQHLFINEVLVLHAKIVEVVWHCLDHYVLTWVAADDLVHIRADFAGH